MPKIFIPASFFRRLLLSAAVLMAFSAALGFGQDLPPQGAVVDEVTLGGPAAKAGISAHDVITEIEGIPLQSMEQIIEALQRHKPGDTMKLTVVKASDGTRAEVTLTLGENPRDQSVPYMGLFVTSYMRLVPERIPAPPGTRSGPGI
ncbi:MAG: PDZ domain-containing protein [Spirochaetia bacterium]